MTGGAETHRGKARKIVTTATAQHLRRLAVAAAATACFVGPLAKTAASPDGPLGVASRATNLPSLAGAPTGAVRQTASDTTSERRPASDLPALNLLASAKGGWRAVAPETVNGLKVPDTKLMVAVREYSNVRGDVVCLGDVARLDGADKETRRLASEIRLGNAPSLGKSLRLAPSLIEASLAHRGLTERFYHLTAPKVIQVAREEQIVRREALIEAATRRLAQLAGVEAPDLILREWNLPPEVRVPAGAVETHVEVAQRGRTVGAQNFEIALRVEGREEARARGSVFVDTLTPVVRAVAPIARGEVILPQQLGVVRAPLTTLTAQAVQDPESAVGKVPTRAVAAGETLRADLLRSQILVKRNDIVLMQVSTGRMHLQTKGVAKTQGGEGEMITVVNPTSGKDVMAKVIGPQRVEVVY